MTQMNEGQSPPDMAQAAIAAVREKIKPEPRTYTKVEMMVMPFAIAIGFLFDRLVIDGGKGWGLYSGIFWICYLVLFYTMTWKKIRTNKILWMFAGFISLLCVWNIFFDYNSVYGRLTFVVVPGVCMGHAVLFGSGYKLKQVFALTVEWFTGWFIKPFIKIPHFFGVTRSLFSSEKNSTLKKVLIAAGITLPLLLIILPLLSGADMIFNLYIRKLIGDFSFADFVGHLIAIAVLSLCFFSFLWSVSIDSPQNTVKIKKLEIDIIISGIVLGVVLVIYALFCMVQFTYLFAGAGLPEGMTYSEYAREGFWQLIVIAGINLLLFGIFLSFGGKSKLLKIMLGMLLAVTAVMIVSGALRLKLYTDVYGLTWLRLISAWFICFIAAVILLCGLRMFKEKIPLFAISAFVLLGWYVVLGYVNPDALIVRYNLAHSQDQQGWVKANYSYLAYELSDDAALVLLEEYPNDMARIRVIKRKAANTEGISISSRKAQQIMRRQGYFVAGDKHYGDGWHVDYANFGYYNGYYDRSFSETQYPRR